MIRNAQPADAEAIAQLIILAMGNSLAGKFANSNNPANAITLFKHFAKLKGNQYSYENILVWDEETEVCGMIIGYDGNDLDKLRQPFLQYITTKLGFEGKPEDETQSGEYYIDCLSVKPSHQGKGIAKKLIKALINKATGLNYNTVGLLVSKTNSKAKQLYTNLGFAQVGEKTLLGGNHYHLQHKG